MLSDAAIRSLKAGPKPTKHADSGGLFILVNPDGKKHWRLAYRFAGKQKLLSGGPYAIARKHKEHGPRFIAYDPGLMPGTELTRDQTAAIRFPWKNILPTTARFMEGASTARRSGALLAELLARKHLPHGTGVYEDFTGHELPSSQLSYDVAVQDALMDWGGRSLLADCGVVRRSLYINPIFCALANANHILPPYSLHSNKSAPTCRANGVE